LAFYQPKAFGADAYRVRYYGEVDQIRVARRHELFPNEFPSAKSNQKYYRINLKNLEERDPPIISTRPRRLIFVPTTWFKFSNAEWINDLFDDSPLEDSLWTEFQKLEINAERQWRVYLKKSFYLLDFALHCNDGPVDIETDGDTWHSKVDRIALDNQRDNDLVSSGWHVLRFNTQQITKQLETYCLGKIQKMINKLGGLSEEGLVPRIFYDTPGGMVQQLSLFEKPGRKYIIEEADPFELD
jgi:very-short-patch-repair endonuclease